MIVQQKRQNKTVYIRLIHPLHVRTVPLAAIILMAMKFLNAFLNILHFLFEGSHVVLQIHHRLARARLNHKNKQAYIYKESHTWKNIIDTAWKNVVILRYQALRVFVNCDTLTCLWPHHLWCWLPSRNPNKIFWKKFWRCLRGLLLKNSDMDRSIYIGWTKGKLYIYITWIFIIYIYLRKMLQSPNCLWRINKCQMIYLQVFVDIANPSHCKFRLFMLTRGIRTFMCRFVVGDDVELRNCIVVFPWSAKATPGTLLLLLHSGWV